MDDREATLSGRPPLSGLVTPESCAVLVQELQNGVVGEEAALPVLADAVRTTGVMERAASCWAQPGGQVSP